MDPIGSRMCGRWSAGVGWKCLYRYCANWTFNCGTSFPGHPVSAVCLANCCCCCCCWFCCCCYCVAATSGTAAAAGNNNVTFGRLPALNLFSIFRLRYGNSPQMHINQLQNFWLLISPSCFWAICNRHNGFWPDHLCMSRIIHARIISI